MERDGEQSEVEVLARIDKQLGEVRGAVVWLALFVLALLVLVAAIVFGFAEVTIKQG